MILPVPKSSSFFSAFSSSILSFLKDEYGNLGGVLNNSWSWLDQKLNDLVIESIFFSISYIDRGGGFDIG